MITPIPEAAVWYRCPTRLSEIVEITLMTAPRHMPGVPLPDATQRYITFGTPEHQAMVEEIRRDLNLTTLKFQQLGKLLTAIGLPPEKVCTYC
jgi:hypothetical protein